MEFTIKTAKEHSKKNLLKNWTISYLQDHGDNIELANLINKKGGYFVGPIEFELKKLTRCAGPEKNMRFVKNKKDWEKNISKLTSFIQNNHEYPPLIVWHKNNDFSIADGNHRHETFIRLGYKEYFTIFWFEKEKDYNNFLKNPYQQP